MPPKRKGIYDRCIEGLTVKQASVLIEIVEFFMQQGRTPTYREIMKIVNIKSTGAIGYYMDIFEEAGYIKRVEDHNSYKVVGLTIIAPHWYYGIKVQYEDTKSRLPDVDWSKPLTGKASQFIEREPGEYL